MISVIILILAVSLAVFVNNSKSKIEKYTQYLDEAECLATPCDKVLSTSTLKEHCTLLLNANPNILDKMFISVLAGGEADEYQQNLNSSGSACLKLISCHERGLGYQQCINE